MVGIPHRASLTTLFVGEKELVRSLLVITLGILSSVIGLAQTSSGRIAGTITDSTGATVKDATVIAINQRTNQRETVNTNEDNNFTGGARGPAGGGGGGGRGGGAGGAGGGGGRRGGQE